MRFQNSKNPEKRAAGRRDFVMILIDTSVWIRLYRKKNSPLGQFVWSLVTKNEAAVCGQILVEFLGGFKNQLERKRFQKLIEEFPYIETSKESYQKAAELLAEFQFLGSGDAVIAATAIQERCPLLTADKDFRRVKKQGLALIYLS